MNIQDFRKGLEALRQSISDKADVFCSIDSKECEKPIRISVYADGICGSHTFMAEGVDMAEALSAALAMWAECRDRVEAATIQSMALEIIRITDDFGDCTDAALRAGKFSHADVARYGERACTKANQMADGGPFSILAEAKANAA